jgi:hypothetical protein
MLRDNKEEKAVFVSSIHPETPVAQADLREGDPGG